MSIAGFADVSLECCDACVVTRRLADASMKSFKEVAAHCRCYEGVPATGAADYASAAFGGMKLEAGVTPIA
jgi:hypothetical protein